MDRDHIGELVGLGGSVPGIKRAQSRAKKAWPPFPHNGCAANLSALLQLAGIDVPMTLGAGKLAYVLQQRGWDHVEVGSQGAGDVGVTFDEGGNPGADHIYLVVRPIDADKMVICDNQSNRTHERFATGKGRTRTEYFLRAG